ALFLTKFFLTAAHPIPQTLTPIQVLENVLQHHEAAGLRTIVPDNNNLEARTEPLVWRNPTIDIPRVFIPSYLGELPLNVPHPENKDGVRSIINLLKSMEKAMGNLEIREIVSKFETKLMSTPYELINLPPLGLHVMNPLSSSQFQSLQSYMLYAVPLHNKGNWLKDSGPRDERGDWVTPDILVSQEWRTPSQHGLPGAGVSTAPGRPPPSTSIPLWERAAYVWVSPYFLPDHKEAVQMYVPSPTAANRDGYDSMIKLLEQLASASAGRHRQRKPLRDILNALKDNYGFPRLSLDPMKPIPDSELPALKDRIKQSLDEHNRKFFIPDPEGDNHSQPAAGPQPFSNSEAAKLAISRMGG
ncbi:hypothetical protein H0H93_006862, partial [Arthromyces matolae]